MNTSVIRNGSRNFIKNSTELLQIHSNRKNDWIKNLQGHTRAIFIPQQEKRGCGKLSFCTIPSPESITMVKSFSGLQHFKVKNSDNPAESKAQDLCQESTPISGCVSGGLCDLRQGYTSPPSSTPGPQGGNCL